MFSMIRIRNLAMAVTGFIGLLGAPGCEARVEPAAEAAPAEAMSLDNVHIVDTETGEVSPLSSIQIDGERIVAIGEPGAFASSGAVVDGAGAYVVPGFNDMHEHVLQSAYVDQELTLLLANGITGFRQMVGSEKMLSSRQKRNLMPADAPELLSMPGQLLRGFMAADRLPGEIESQKEAGADFIKSIDLPSDRYLEALRIAKGLGMPTTGHLPSNISVLEANDAGMDAVEHIGPSESITVSCSSQEEAIRAELAKQPGNPIRGKLPSAFAERILANPGIARLRVRNGASLQITEWVNSTFDEQRCRALAGELSKRKMWQIPTLIRLQTFSYADDASFREDPALKYVHMRDESLWSDLADDFTKLATADQRKVMEEDFQAKLRLVRIFDEAGVPMLTGSDSGQWEVPGFSLHREFDLLASAGLSPLKVLQMTTLYPADFLGRRDDMGTVAPGKLANIVILRRNPMEEVSALHDIAGVVNRGKYYSRADLDALLAEVEGTFARK